MTFGNMLVRSFRAPLRILRNAARAVRRPRLQTCTVHGHAIKVWVTTEIEDYRARTYATKEPDTLSWLARNLHPGEVFFDVGANVGLYSLYAAAVAPTATVYAFEPEAQNFANLCRNILANAFVNVIPSCLTIADGERFDLLHVKSGSAGDAFNTFGTESLIDSARTPRMVQGALSVSIDELVFRHKLPAPQLIKIDVDGIETRILRGATRVLSLPQLRSVQVELNASSESDVMLVRQSLESCGLCLSSQSDWEERSGDVRSRNYVFSRA
jgi:FkbM family methyltransferase